MRRLQILIIAAAGSAGWLRAADIAVLTDGDRLTGSVQKLEKGKLFFKTRHSETPLQIDWALVTGLTTEAEMTLTLRGGAEESGKLVASTAGLGVSSAITSGVVKTILPASVAALAPKEKGDSGEESGWIRRAWNRSSISVDLDQSYSGLAKYNQVSSNTEIEYKGDRWDGSLVTHLDYYGGTDSDRSTYQTYGRFVGQRYLRGDRFFLFPYSFLGRQTTSDGGRGQLRQYGGGAGWTFRRQQPNQVSLYGGLVRSATHGFKVESDEGRTDVNSRATLFVAAVSWERELKRNVSASVRLFYFRPISAPGHNAMATDASMKIKIFGPAYFTVRAYDTPELAQKQWFSTKNLQLSSGIGIEF